MSNSDLDPTGALERRYGWQIATGMVIAVAGIGCFVAELLFHYDSLIQHTGA
jgi:hypothetical protein